MRWYIFIYISPISGLTSRSRANDPLVLELKGDRSTRGSIFTTNPVQKTRRNCWIFIAHSSTMFVTMDFVKALKELHDEKKRLDAAIAALEARIRTSHGASAAKPQKGRRGRKSMSAVERLEVSRRMTLYWESRRAKIQGPTTVPPGSVSSIEDHQASIISGS